MTKRILVIEDEDKHEQDARAFFAKQPDVEVKYARNYLEACEIMYVRDYGSHERIKGNIDGVISDIHFPFIDVETWDEPGPIGVRVAVELSQLGVPFVLCTADSEYSRRNEWIYSFAREQNWKMITSGVEWEQCCVYKDWERAYKTLEERMT